MTARTGRTAPARPVIFRRRAVTRFCAACVAANGGLHRQLQRGVGSADALTQRATFGARQVASQRRPCEFMLHDVVPIALPTPWLLVLLLVVVRVS